MRTLLSWRFLHSHPLGINYRHFYTSIVLVFLFSSTKLYRILMFSQIGSSYIWLNPTNPTYWINYIQWKQKKRGSILSSHGFNQFTIYSLCNPYHIVIWICSYILIIIPIPIPYGKPYVFPSPLCSFSR